jgi:hypothetical protein
VKRFIESRREHGRSPISGEPLDVEDLIENWTVQDQIDSYHDAAAAAATEPRAALSPHQQEGEGEEAALSSSSPIGLAYLQDFQAALAGGVDDPSVWEPEPEPV